MIGSRGRIGRKADARFLQAAVGLLVLATASVVGAQAQSPQNDLGPYVVQGQVTTPEGDPAAESRVTLISAEGETSERETRTGPQGGYRFASVPEGRYHLVADHDCCGPRFEPVTLEGTTATSTVDLELTEQPSPQSDVTVVLYGRTTEVASGKPVGETRLDLTYVGEEGKRRHVGLSSGPNGTYAVETRASDVTLEAMAPDSYHQTRARFEASDGREAFGERELTVPVKVSKGVARLSGRIQAPGGDPIQAAQVEVHPPRNCEPAPCDRRAPHPPRDERIQRDNVTFYVEHEAARYHQTQTDEDGRWSMVVAPEPLEVSAHARGYTSTERRLSPEAGENRTLNLTLDPIPEDSVDVRGTVADARTGEPIELAIVHLENRRWRSEDRTRTADDGTFHLETKPGYHVLRVRTLGGCIPAPVSTMASSPQPRPSRSEPSETVAVPPCQEVQRERSYFPRSRSLLAQPNETVRIDVALRPHPDASATIRGWVIDASNQQGVPDARLDLENELTHEDGRARTDENGSYTIDVTPGYYTLEARAQGYFEAVENVRVGPNETAGVVLEMTAGSPHREPCCTVYAEGGDETREASATRPAGPAESQTRVDGPEDQAVAFQGEGGGLGPYEPHERNGPSSEGARSTPGPGPALAFALAVSALALRRRS